MATESSRNSIGVRVRPNANGFINDLRTDLGSKKYTFYVDVKAQTQAATRDVKRWAATELREINAKVYVAANMSRATSDVARWRERQSQIKTQVHVTANMFEANRDVAAWRAIAGRDLEIKVKANVSGRLTEIERLRKTAEREAKMTVRGDTSKIKQDVRQGIQDAQMSMFEVEVDANTKKAQLKVNEFITQGEQLGFDLELDLDTTKAEVKTEALKQKIQKDNPRATVLLETAEARRDLAKLRLEAARKKLAVEVELKQNSWKKLNKQVEKFEKGLGGGSVIRSLDFGPINLGKPTGFLGTMTQITAFAGLVPGLVTGVAALSDVFVRLAGSVSMLPGLLASLGASFGTFQVGAFGFADALDAMFKVWTEPTDRIERNQRNTIKWTNDLSKALDNEKQAQKAVGNARRDATNELRNLNNELRGSVLNEAQAILDLQRAKDRLAQGDFENNTERIQAQLDVAQGEQRLLEVRERGTQLAQEAAQKQKAGVEGSDQVTAAMEAQARATEAVALAMQSISMANPMGAQSLFEDAMDRLSPKAQAAVQAIGGLRSEITLFQRGLQDVMFDGVAEKITSTFQNLAPTIEPGMNAIAQGLNQNILQIFDTLNSNEGKSIIERILGGTAEAQKMLSGLIDPLIRGFGTLMAAGAEHMPQLIQLFTQLADRFALFIDQADKSGALDKFLDEGITALGNLAELGINMIQIINDFSTAFRSAFGTDLLTKMVQITDKWHEFLSSEEGQKRLNKYITEAKDVFNEWKPILEKLPELFNKVQTVAQNFLEFFLPILDKALGLFEKFPGLVEAFAGAWIGAKMFGAAKGIAELFGGIWKLGGAVLGLGSSMGGFLARVAPYLPLLGQFGAGRGGNPFGGPFLPPGTPAAGGAAAGGAAAGGAAGQNGAKPAPAKPSKLSGVKSFLGKAGRLLGGALLPAVIGLEVWNSLSNDAAANDTYSEWQNIRNATSDPVKKREIDRGVYSQLGIEIGESGDYPMLSQFDFNNLANPSPLSQAAQGGNGTYKVKDGKIYPDGSDQPLQLFPSYKTGGLTDWPKGMGKNAMLHGQEFVLPAESVDFYGKDFMEALRQRKLNFEDGGGLVLDPLSGRYINPSEQPHGGQPHLGSQGPGILNTIASGVTGIVSNAANQAVGAAGNMTPGMGTGPLPGPPQPGMGTGPLPGPALTAPTGPGGFPGVEPKPLSVNIGGLDLPIGAGVPTGWPTPDGLPPPGLGRDGFDIRNFGIGPGPAGSTPGDWMKWTTGFLGSTVTNLGTALLGGVLGIFGLEGAMSNPYITSAFGLGKNFLEAANGDQKTQAAGADAANAQASGLLGLYGQMPMNPAYPGVPGALPPELQGYFPGYGMQFPTGSPMPGLPGVLTPGQGFIPGGSPLGPGNIPGGEGGLQRDTIAARRVLSAAFPFLQDIGGYRQDELQWHPSGRALDAMIPGGATGTPQGVAIGDQIASYVLQNADELGVENVIWNDKIYQRGQNGAWAASDYQAAANTVTERHMDHVHIQFKGAGMPDANTKYYAPASGIVQYMLDEQGFPVVAGMPNNFGSQLPGRQGLFTPSSGTPISPTAPGQRASGVNASGAAQAATAMPGTGNGVNTPKADSKNSAGALLGNLLTGGSAPQPSSSGGGVKDKAKAAFLAAGYKEEDWVKLADLINGVSQWNPSKQGVGKGNRKLFGIGQMSESDMETYGIKGSTDAMEQFKAIVSKLKNSYNNDVAAAARMVNFWGGFARGGAVWGAGSGVSDSIPALLSNGEHVLTAKEVEMMGGQDGVYAFRSALQNNKFAYGGAVTAYVPPKPPIPPVNPAPAPAPAPPVQPAGPQYPPAATNQPTMEPKPSPIEQPPAPAVEPQPAPPPVGQLPGTPPAPEPPPDPNVQQGPQGGEITDIASQWLNGGVGTAQLDRNHPALSSGIMSGAAALGNVITTAVQAAATAGVAGGTMGAGAPAGAAAGALASSLISGAFQQGGKIVEGAANVASNFLVGNLTGGTTENSYGVTQVANQPTGGTKIYDASTSIGSIQTADLDGYYRMENRRQAQRAQSGLGHWGNR